MACVTLQDSIGVVAMDLSHDTLLETALRIHSVGNMMSSHMMSSDYCCLCCHGYRLGHQDMVSLSIITVSW